VEIAEAARQHVRVPRPTIERPVQSELISIKQESPIQQSKLDQSAMKVACIAHLKDVVQKKKGGYPYAERLQCVQARGYHAEQLRESELG
jgi:hypothetical protein